APLFPMSLWEQQEACRRWRSDRGGQIGVQVSVKTRFGGWRAPACSPHASIQGSRGRALSLRGWRLRRLATGPRAPHLRFLTCKDFVQPTRERIFNVPGFVLSLLAVMVLVHAVNELVLSTEQANTFLDMFAFVPARYDLRILRQFPWTLGWGAAVWTFLT